MNVTWYVSKFDEATWSLMALLGITRSYMLENHRAMAAVEQAISYKRELRAGDTVTVRSRVLEVKEKAIRYCHEMVNNDTGDIAAATTLASLHFDADARKACAFPAVILERVRRMAAELCEPEP